MSVAVEAIPQPKVAGRRDIYEVSPEGRLSIVFHPGQVEAWQNRKRITLVTAGTQSGKTSFGPMWLERAIQEGGPGDYLIVTPTYALLDLKLLPELRRYFEHTRQYGKYFASPRRRFTFTPEGEERMWGRSKGDDLARPTTNIFFGYAEDPESLESMTVKAAWLDEAGQKKFKLGSWYAILRRLSLSEGPILITTTPYNLGWLYQKLYLPWKNGTSNDVSVVQFDSTKNPAFPVSEWRRAKAEMPSWMFNMLYRGRFERPAGLIYESFDRKKHTCRPFTIPPTWERYLGLDFGAVNTVGVFYAKEPASNRLFLYRTYKAGNRVAQAHVNRLLENEPMIPIAVGGMMGEHNWRDEFAAAGLPVREPDVVSVEVGINRVIGAHQHGEIIVFEDQGGYLDQKETYSRVIDVNGNPTDQIDDPHAYHYMDAERYVVGWIRSGDTGISSQSRSTHFADVQDIAARTNEFGYTPSSMWDDDDRY